MMLAHRTRTTLAVLALAAGLIGTTLPTSALAAQTGPTNHPTPNVPHTPPPTQNTGRHKPDGPPPPEGPLPDVSVTVVSSNGSNAYPDHLDVAFNLLTTGADANNVALKAQCIYHSFAANTPDTRYEDQPVKQMSLSASWPVPVPYLVTCNPDYMEEVHVVTLTAVVPGGDANSNNNFASWDYVKGPWK